MNLFFYQTHRYRLSNSAQEANARLKALVSRRFEDYSVDLVGNLYNDGRFFLGNKWPIPGMTKFERKAAYIKGALQEDSHSALIKLSIRPHKVFIILFYSFLILTGVEASGVENFIPVEPKYKIGTLIGIDLALLSLLFIFPYRIKQRFERLTEFSIE